jgi:NadR type nicotinamide-nucleotide adenylyltransferase|tara:strand:+ start:216 stop:767 length:552 start_codon:yes stop_codon:yes gene_type:complete
MEKNLQSKNYCLKIVLFGPECTGKTTLAKLLANHYNTQWVPEFAREYLQNKWDKSQKVCTKEDLPVIVSSQLKLETNKISKAIKYLFCDTNILVTRIWSETHFDGYCDPEIIKLSEEINYDYYLLTSIDIPWIKDNLRDRPNDREKMFSYFKETLDKNNKPYSIIKGHIKERLSNCIKIINNL